MKTTVRRILAVILLFVSVWLIGYGYFTCSRLAPDVGETDTQIKEEEVYDEEEATDPVRDPVGIADAGDDTPRRLLLSVFVSAARGKFSGSRYVGSLLHTQIV